MPAVTDKQPIIFKVRLPTHADQATWDLFVARAERDGRTLGDLFRGLIHAYAAGATTLELPPAITKRA